MSTMTKRSTIYFEPSLHRALRLKAAETSRSVSELVNDATREYLSEDQEDLGAFEERSAEPLVSYEEMLKKLRADGRL
jgi:metal-responsive CopG/Arc/MetJ family transcriptional regulator